MAFVVPVKFFLERGQPCSGWLSASELAGIFLEFCSGHPCALGILVSSLVRLLLDEVR